MDTLQKLQRIQDEEINYQISCFFDEGFVVKIGDPVNGFKYTSPLCDNFEEAALHLIASVMIFYPELVF